MSLVTYKRKTETINPRLTKIKSKRLAQKQKGYGLYTNKLSGSRPSSGRICNNPEKCAETSKPIWKQMKTYDSSIIIEKNKINAIRCANATRNIDPVSRKPTAGDLTKCFNDIGCQNCKTKKTKKPDCLNITKDIRTTISSGERTMLKKGDGLSAVCKAPPLCKDKLNIYLHIDSNGIITNVSEGNCVKTILKTEKYKVFLTSETNETFTIHTNHSEDPRKTCDIFYNKTIPSDLNEKQIANIKISNSYCPNRIPILYFKTSKNSVKIQVSKNYEGFTLPLPKHNKSCIH